MIGLSNGGKRAQDCSDDEAGRNAQSGRALPTCHQSDGKPRQSLSRRTLAVNLLGCFVIGVLGGRLLGDPSMLHHPTARALVFVGILGGFTTFSAFALDTLTLVHSGRQAAALVNAVGQPVFGLLAAYLGWWLSLRG